MEFPLEEEHRLIVDVVRRFVAEDLLPAEKGALERESAGLGLTFDPEVERTLNARARALGLWGLDVPPEFGGYDLPASAMVAINFELGKTIAKLIRDKYPKLKAQLQGDAVRVSGSSKDMLQGAMKLLKEQDYVVPLQFNNYR